jgi:hypothetical protein
MTLTAPKAADLGPNYEWTALANATAAVVMSQLDGSIVLIALTIPTTTQGITS